MPHKPEKRYLYNAWKQMVLRCTYPAHPAYKDYGERGIKVCRRWRTSFTNFVADIGARPSPAHSLERRNNARGYTPANVYWATDKEQSNNRRSNRYVTFRGETKTVTQWAEQLFPENPERIQTRFSSGWDTERALTTPIRAKRR